MKLASDNQRLTIECGLEEAKAFISKNPNCEARSTENGCILIYPQSEVQAPTSIIKSIRNK
jgi:hypothetical protein